MRLHLELHRLQKADAESADVAAAKPPVVHAAAPWLLWLLGAAMLATVIIAALHFSEAREFARIAETSQPWWLLLAVLFQAGTYSAQGEVLRCVSRAGRFSLRLRAVYELSLAKLFVDQALPSAGLTGTFMLATALERRGMRRSLVAAFVVIDLATFYAAYVLCLAAALILAFVHSEANKLLVWATCAFAFYAIAVSTAAMLLSGRPLPAVFLRLAHFRPVQRTLKFLEQADSGLVRNWPVALQATLYQLAIFLFDAATVWILVKSLGVTVSLSGVFTSFMISTLFRSIGVLPGGLGSFEAASVLTLKMVGVPVAVALAATLLFRGLSFWIPMLPGFWCSRCVMAQHPGHISRP